MWAKLTKFYPATVLGEFTNTFNSFLAFGIKTKQDLVEVGAEGVDFPAITFCSASAVRRTVAGVSFLVRNPLVMIATAITDPVELDQMGKMCTANATAEEVDCKWNSREINCAQSFINKPTDAGICFTFNPALNLLKTYELISTTERNANLSAAIRTYGMTSSDWKPYVSKNTGPKSGFSIALLTNTTDYCASFLGYGGFVATVHDPMAEPLTFTKNGINLSPGWQTNVAMSLTKTDRRPTESLSYCKSQLDLLTFKSVVDYTSRDYFILDCLTSKIISECQCVPFYSPRGNVYFHWDFPTVYFAVTNSSPINTCGWAFGNTAPDIICQHSAEKKALRADGGCYLSAPKPCEETQISTKTTASLWPNDELLSHFKRQINGTVNMSLAEFQQNFLFANFFFEDYHYTLVTESLKMTWVDLMNQLGGAMGMSVGLSILGVVELLVWLLTRPIVAFSNYRSTANQNERLPNVPAYRT